MKFSSMILPAAALTMLFAACQDEDFGVTTQEVRNSKYAQEFVKKFGKVSPDQDWSVATSVTASVNLPQITGTAKMNICTGDPRNAETRLLAQVMLNNGKAEFNFDAIEGQNDVFVTIEKDGKYELFKQYALVNGFLGIGDVQMPMTRVGVGNVTEVSSFSSTCPTTQRTGTTATVDYTYFNNIVSTTKIDGIKYPKTDSYTNSNNMKTLEGWIAYAKSGGVIVTWNQWTKSVTNNTPFTDESMLKFSKITKSDFSGVVLKDANYAEENSDGTITLYLDAGGKSANSGWISKKTVAEWQQDAINNYSGIVSGTYNGPWTNESLLGCFTLAPCSKDDDGAVYDGMTDETTWELKDSAEPHYANVYPTFQYLDKVEQSSSPAITLGDFNSFFGSGNFFAESVSVWDGSKLGKYYDEATMRKMENGYSIVTTQGQVIELPYVFGCTAYCNQFGYIYYKEADEENIDPITLKHYVLIEDGRPSKNIYRDSWKGTAVACESNNYAADEFYNYTMTDANGNTFTGNYNGLSADKDKEFVCTCNEQAGTGIYSDEHKHESTCYSPADRYAQIAAKSFYGTTYRPMFFGEDGDASQGTYEWPAGYKIVFWINSLATDDPDGAGKDELVRTHPESCFTSSGGKGNHFNYSLPTINKRLFHDYQGSLTHTAEELETLGQVQCISWTVEGTIFLAFGDMSTDKDLNDMVFMVSAPNSDPNNTVVTVPVKWHLNYNGEPEDNDLFDNYTLNIGADYTNPKNGSENANPTRIGYKFAGWSLSDPEASFEDENVKEDVSGTVTKDDTSIHYYAIWEPLVPYTITWHNNYDPDVYGSDDCGKDDPETDATDIHKQEIVAENEQFSKPESDPTAPRDKVFKGWSLTPTGDVLDESWFEDERNMTAFGDVKNICFYAIYENDPEVGPDPEPISWIFACEDLGGTYDYDFNDVVWEVRKNYDSNSNAFLEVRLLAAGGTLPFQLNYGETKVVTKAEACGGEENCGTVYEMLSCDWIKVAEVESSWTLKDHSGDFKVLVKNGKEQITSVSTSSYSKDKENKENNTNIPQVIILPSNWAWPLEGHGIDAAYPDFTEWVSDGQPVQWNTPVAGETVSRGSAPSDDNGVGGGGGSSDDNMSAKIRR